MASFSTYYSQSKSKTGFNARQNDYLSLKSSGKRVKMSFVSSVFLLYIKRLFLANCCGVFLLFTLIAFICLKFLSSRHHSDKCMNLSDSSYVFLRNIISFSLVYQVESGFTGHTGFNLSFKPLVSIHDQLVCAFSLKQEVLRNRTGCPSITSQPEDKDTHRLACGAFKGLCPRWCIQGSSL